MRGTVDKTVDTVSVFFLCFIIFNGELPVHFVAGFQMSFFFSLSVKYLFSVVRVHFLNIVVTMVLGA